MKTNILFGLSTFFIALLLLSFVSACADYGVYKQGTSISLIQTCSNCNSINASIVYPDGTQTGSFAFQNINNVYNYTFTNTTQLGTYNVIGLDAWCYNFDITPSGSNQTTAQGIGSLGIIFLVISLMIIFMYLGYKFINMDTLWAMGVFMMILSLIMLTYGVWLTYEFKLNYTGSTPDSIIPQTIFYIFMTTLTIGIGVALVLLFTKWKEVVKKFKNAIKPEEDSDDLI